MLTFDTIDAHTVSLFSFFAMNLIVLYRTHVLWDKYAHLFELMFKDSVGPKFNQDHQRDLDSMLRGCNIFYYVAPFVFCATAFASTTLAWSLFSVWLAVTLFITYALNKVARALSKKENTQARGAGKLTIIN